MPPIGCSAAMGVHGCRSIPAINTRSIAHQPATAHDDGGLPNG
jgi:hypothetical protein